MVELRAKTTPPATWREISQRLGGGFSEAVVRAHYRRKLAPNSDLETGSTNPRHWTSAQVEQLESLSSSGMSLREIAHTLNKSYVAVAAKRHRFKYGYNALPGDAQPRAVPWSEGHLTELSKLSANQHDSNDLKDFAIRTGRSFAAVRRKLDFIQREDKRRAAMLIDDPKTLA